MSAPSHADHVRTFLTESTPGEFTMAVQGTSMAPAIREGDALDVRRAGADELRLGDVVVFYPDGWSRPCVHRIVWKRLRDGALPRLYTKGDARPSVECFEENALVGRVEGVHRDGRAVHGWRRARLFRALWGCVAFVLGRALRRAANKSSAEEPRP